MYADDYKEDRVDYLCQVRSSLRPGEPAYLPKTATDPPAKLRFRQGRSIGVAIHLYGHLIQSAHFLGQRVVMPDREIGRIDNDPSFGI